MMRYLSYHKKARQLENSTAQPGVLTVTIIALVAGIIGKEHEMVKLSS